ncbi:hypothetical protein BC829DRAFT_439646 [Chytridium lagenaria]|nr:hypothetical protein BC829DRAFT_439646 [Chytridium lagenaria]
MSGNGVNGVGGTGSDNLLRIIRMDENMRTDMGGVERTLSDTFVRNGGNGVNGMNNGLVDGPARFTISFGEEVGRRVEVDDLDSIIKKEVSSPSHHMSDVRILVPRETGAVVSFSNKEDDGKRGASTMNDDGHQRKKARVEDPEAGRHHTGMKLSPDTTLPPPPHISIQERVVQPSEGEGFRISIHRGVSNTSAPVASSSKSKTLPLSVSLPERSSGNTAASGGLVSPGLPIKRRTSRVVDKDLLTLELFEACSKGKAQIIHNILDNEWPDSDDISNAPYSKYKGSLLLAWVSSTKVNITEPAAVLVIKKIVNKFKFAWKQWSQENFQTALSWLIYRDAIQSARNGRKSIEFSEATRVVLDHSSEHRLKTPWVYPATVLTFTRNVRLLGDRDTIITAEEQVKTGKDHYQIMIDYGIPVGTYVEIIRAFQEKCLYDVNAKHSFKDMNTMSNIGEVLDQRRDPCRIKGMTNLGVTSMTWESLKLQLIQVGTNFKGERR